MVAINKLISTKAIAIFCLIFLGNWLAALYWSQRYYHMYKRQLHDDKKRNHLPFPKRRSADQLSDERLPHRNPVRGDVEEFLTTEQFDLSGRVQHQSHSGRSRQEQLYRVDGTDRTAAKSPNMKKESMSYGRPNEREFYKVDRMATKSRGSWQEELPNKRYDEFGAKKQHADAKQNKQFESERELPASYKKHYEDEIEGEDRPKSNERESDKAYRKLNEDVDQLSSNRRETMPQSAVKIPPHTGNSTSLLAIDNFGFIKKSEDLCEDLYGDAYAFPVKSSVPPHFCALHPYDLYSFTQCMQRQRRTYILFMGDSRIRLKYFTFLNLVDCKLTQSGIINMSHAFNWRNFYCTNSNYKVDFWWTPLLNDTVLNLFVEMVGGRRQPPNVIITSYGLHYSLVKGAHISGVVSLTDNLEKVIQIWEYLDGMTDILYLKQERLETRKFNTEHKKYFMGAVNSVADGIITQAKTKNIHYIRGTYQLGTNYPYYDAHHVNEKANIHAAQLIANILCNDVLQKHEQQKTKDVCCVR